jgi:ADP-ribose pyrophosphatase YjhB (NUDIX family)
VNNENKRLQWAKRIQALAQSGLTYCKDPYDIERYEEFRDISIEMMASILEQDTDKVRSLFASEVGYATPKVGVRAAIFKGDKILLVQERADGCWCLPGGWSDIGDTPTQTVIKEVKEESGYDVQVKKLIALFDRKCHDQPPSIYDIYTLYFHCDIIGGAPTLGIETEDIGFFGESEIPKLELSTERITPSQLHLIFKYLYDPKREAYFD